MKKEYIAPTVDLFEYDVEDTLLTSGGGINSILSGNGETEADAPASWLNP